MAMIFRFKKQAAKGSPASGAGATELRILPGQGAQRTVATIERAILDRSGMKAKSRQGSFQVPITIDTEVEAQNADAIFIGIQGAAATAPIELDEGDLTSLAISASGTVATVGGGDLRALGIRAGMLFKLGGMATSANNDKWVPVLAVPTATTMALGPAQDRTFLTDETADTAFTLTTGNTYQGKTPRDKDYYTCEFYDDAKDRSRVIYDARFTNFQLSIAANQTLRMTVGLLGLDIAILDTGDAPLFDANPVEGEALLLLDGVLTKDGEVAAEVQSLTLGLQAQGNITPLATSRKGADVGVSQFAFSGQLNELVTDYAALQSAIDEDDLSLFAMFAHRSAPSEIVSLYAGNCSYAQANNQVADDDAEADQQQATLYGGKDTRGEANGYSASTFVFSTTYGL